MGFFGYNFNVPNTPNDPSDDQPQMLINTVSIGNLIAVDHVGFSTVNGGYHTVIHQGNAPGNTDPASITNIGQLYVKTVTLNSIMDQQLFFESGQGVVTQLTSGIATSPGTNGYVFLPGGILLQWGFKNGPHGGAHTFTNGDSGSITFPLAFPTNVFTINANLNFNSTTAGVPASSSGEVVSFDTSSITTTGANFFIAGSGATYTRFFWIAIGN